MGADRGAGAGMTTPWHDDEVVRLRALAGQGLSAGQIAARLKAEFGSGRSRNAVIGKLMRGKGGFGRLLRAPGWVPQPAAIPAPREPKPVCRKPAPAKALPAPAPAPASPPVASLPAPVPMSFLEAMFSGRCLFFAGEPFGPAGPDMPVCGAERARSAPPHNRYCARHLCAAMRPREAVAA